MTTEEKNQLIRASMLRILSDCSGYLIPENVFFQHVQIATFPPVTLKEFVTELRWLEANNYIDGIHPELGGPRKWKITDLGKTVL